MIYRWLCGLCAVLMGLAAVAACAEESERAAGPRRVISLSPNLTESVYAMGAEELLVGRSMFCAWPPEALELKNCGGWANPNFEVITKLDPDMILLLGRHESVSEFAEARGIAVEQFEMDDSETILAGIRKLGRVLGREDAATSLALRIEAELGELAGEIEELEMEQRPLTFLSLTRSQGSLASIFTAAGDSFIAESLELAGGRNAFAELTQPYAQVSKEALLMRNPEVVLEIQAGMELTSESRRMLVADWEQLPTLAAVREGRIHVLNEAYLMIPGPRIVLMVRRLRAALFPGGIPKNTP